MIYSRYGVFQKSLKVVNTATYAQPLFTNYCRLYSVAFRRATTIQSRHALLFAQQPVRAFRTSQILHAKKDEDLYDILGIT